MRRLICAGVLGVTAVLSVASTPRCDDCVSSSWLQGAFRGDLLTREISVHHVQVIGLDAGQQTSLGLTFQIRFEDELISRDPAQAATSGWDAGTFPEPPPAAPVSPRKIDLALFIGPNPPSREAAQMVLGKPQPIGSNVEGLGATLTDRRVFPSEILGALTLSEGGSFYLTAVRRGDAGIVLDGTFQEMGESAHCRDCVLLAEDVTRLVIESQEVAP